MTIEFHDATNHDGLFDVQGKIFFAVQTALTAAKTTIPTEINDAVSALELLPVDLEITDIIGGIDGLVKSIQSGITGPLSGLTSRAGTLLIETVENDNPQPDGKLETALVELINQMLDNAQSVDASTVTVAATPDGSNVGDGVLLVSKKRGDGRSVENALTETLTALASASGRTAGVKVTGIPLAGKLTADWPAGSGTSKNLQSVYASSSLLSNGDLETEADVDNAPDHWITSVGTIGTTLKMTNVEVQTITITGTPSAGFYTISWSNAAGKVQTTGPLAYNAAGSTVQAALNLLEGLEHVTVATSGTTPNFTHTITFTGRGGNVAQFTVTNVTTGGTITPATSSAGTAQVYADGKALEFDSDGSQLTTLNQLVAVEPATVYAVSLWAIADVVPAAGVLKLDLVDGIGGTVINDDQGVANSVSFNGASLTTSWQHLSAVVSGECAFRTPTNLPDLVYLRLRISTAVSSGTSVFVDNVALTKMTELYAGGPWAALFSGKTGIIEGDRWTIVVTNDRAGLMQEFYLRAFDMDRLGLLLPSNSAGAETIPDTVIS